MRQGLGLYRRLLGTLRPYRAAVLFSVAAMVLVAATEPLLPALLKPLVDESLIARDATAQWQIPLLLVAIFVVKGLVGYVSEEALKVLTRSCKGMLESCVTPEPPSDILHLRGIQGVQSGSTTVILGGPCALLGLGVSLDRLLRCEAGSNDVVRCFREQVDRVLCREHENRISAERILDAGATEVPQHSGFFGPQTVRNHREGTTKLTE